MRRYRNRSNMLVRRNRSRRRIVQYKRAIRLKQNCPVVPGFQEQGNPHMSSLPRPNSHALSTPQGRFKRKLIYEIQHRLHMVRRFRESSRLAVRFGAPHASMDTRGQQCRLIHGIGLVSVIYHASFLLGTLSCRLHGAGASQSASSYG